MKKLIATLLSLILLASVFTSTASAAAEKFTDVKPGKWYYTAVDYAVSEKLFNGTSATTFSPDEPMTRGMFVTVLGNKAKIDPKDYPTSSFSDVKAGVWYAPNVEWAAQNGIVNGTGGGKFRSGQDLRGRKGGGHPVPDHRQRWEQHHQDHRRQRQHWH